MKTVAIFVSQYNGNEFKKLQKTSSYVLKNNFHRNEITDC